MEKQAIEFEKGKDRDEEKVAPNDNEAGLFKEAINGEFYSND